MTGIVNKVGSSSGAVGTMTSSPATVTASGSETLTNKDLSALTNILPAGSIVQCSGITTNTTNTSGTSHNSWTNTACAAIFACRYSDSDVNLIALHSADLGNTTGDSGYALRWKAAITGGATTYPQGLDDYGPGSFPNAHSRMYRNAWTGHAHDTHTWDGLHPAVGSTSNITYTLCYATYNTESFSCGTDYNSRWMVSFKEIKR